MTGGALPSQQRTEAIDRILRLCEDPDAAAVLVDALADQPATLLERVLARLTVVPRPPGTLAPWLAELATDPDPAPAGLWEAMGRYRAREVVAALVRALQRASDTEEAGSIRRALVRISGRDDLGADPDAWQRWLDDRRWLNEVQWQREMAEGLAAQRDRLAAARRSAVSRLVELSRAMYLTLEPGPQRSERLAELLHDDEPALRQLGFDLARRELLAATGALDGKVGAAALELLGHPDARVRAQAANLVIQLSPESAGEAIARALSGERAPEAAAAMLPGVASWPRADVLDAVLRWLGSGHAPARDAAESAALALQREGRLDEAASREVLRSLRDRGLANLSGVGMRLLARLGDDEDRKRLGELIGSDDASRSHVAAESLAPYPAYLDRIIESAADRPELFDVAAEAILRHRPSREGYERLTSLPAPNDDVLSRARVRLARVLAPQDLHLVAAEEPAVPVRHALLSWLHDREAGAGEHRGALARCLLLLAETELAMGSPSRALEALERVPGEEEGIDAARLRRARAIALLATGRIDAGAALEAPAEAWIRALELSVEAAHGPALLASFRQRFEGDLDETQAQRVEALAGAIASPDPTPREAPDEEVTDAGGSGSGGGG